MFLSRLEKAHTQGRVTTFVVDEAHCCSQSWKMFLSRLEKAHTHGCVTAFVVNEAHCCSQVGWG
ncbi:hypothetical protein T484DRAFT_1776809 [Baffinella frigidus]|nr:hypothetical protein T484DRAFT_1776809 [Cryptophyta sp. CCMP2293]